MTEMKTAQLSDPPQKQAWWKRALACLCRLPGTQYDAAGRAVPDFGFTPKKGRYRTDRELARGGMGIIHAVNDLDLGRTSAMKVALPAILRQAENAERFVNEARITARLEHPNIVPVHDIGFSREHALFFTMKLIEGEPLDEILARIAKNQGDYGSRYDLHELLVILRKVCDAIAFAHSQNIAHLDIKPENIMVGQYGEVLVMDWGIAQPIRPPQPGEPAAVLPLYGTPKRGEIKGTPSYMAPEQATGSSDLIDERTDVFLLGACLYHMLALCPPYPSGDTDAVLKLAARGDITPPDRANPARQIPEELSAIVMKALAPNRADRYASVAALTQDIDRFMAGRMLTQQRAFIPGEIMMREGEQGMEAYVLLTGQVVVTKRTSSGQQQIALLGPGDIVGEMALITHEPRSATVTAKEPTEVLVITETYVHEALRTMPPWLGRIVNALALRVRQSTARIHPLLVHGAVYQVLQVLELLLANRDTAESQTPALPDEKHQPDDDPATVIALMLGLDRDLVARVLNQAAQHGLLTPDGTGEFRLAAPDTYARFLAYARSRVKHEPATETNGERFEHLWDALQRAARQ